MTLGISENSSIGTSTHCRCTHRASPVSAAISATGHDMFTLRWGREARRKPSGKVAACRLLTLRGTAEVVGQGWLAAWVGAGVPDALPRAGHCDTRTAWGGQLTMPLWESGLEQPTKDGAMPDPCLQAVGRMPNAMAQRRRPVGKWSD